MRQTDIFPFPISRVILCGTSAQQRSQYFITLPTQRQQRNVTSDSFAKSTTDNDDVCFMFRLSKLLWHLFKQSISIFAFSIHGKSCRFNAVLKSIKVNHNFHYLSWRTFLYSTCVTGGLPLLNIAIYCLVASDKLKQPLDSVTVGAVSQWRCFISPPRDCGCFLRRQLDSLVGTSAHA